MEFDKHFKLNSMLKYITVILFIVISTVKAQETLIPKFSNDLRQAVFFDARETAPLFLSCKPSVSGYKLKWAKNGQDVSQVGSLAGRYEFKEDSFMVRDTTPDDHGNYTCSIPDLNLSADIRVVSVAYLKKLHENMVVVEGEKLTIHCKALGTAPEIIWTVGNNTNLNLSHITLKDDDDHVKDAILVIEHAELTDRTWYNCTAKNEATEYGNFEEDKEATYVRVKGKLAALWPFLGICAEVFILCAIILVYEKRRNKEGLDESDTDQSPEQEKLKTGK